MNKALVAVGGVAVGAGIMYLADPSEGRRRRGRVRDAGVHLTHTLTRAAGKTSPDVARRWTPTTRLIAAAAGLTLVALSTPNRTLRGAATGIAGLELLEHAVLGGRDGV
jgi:hypothetical protein